MAYSITRSGLQLLSLDLLETFSICPSQMNKGCEIFAYTSVQRTSRPRSRQPVDQRRADVVNILRPSAQYQSLFPTAENTISEHAFLLCVIFVSVSVCRRDILQPRDSIVVGGEVTDSES